MTDVNIAATIEIENEEDTWESVGKKLGEYLEPCWNGAYEWSDVVLKVEDVPEDGVVMLSIPGGHLSIRIPRWQLIRALELIREASK